MRYFLGSTLLSLLGQPQPPLRDEGLASKLNMQEHFQATMLWSLVVLAAIFRARAVGAVATTERQNPHLKEILMGRCYENPPNMDPSDGGTAMCSFVVDSLFGVLEGQPDDEIDDSSYFMYLGMTSYDSHKDSAFFIWPPPSTQKDTAKVLSANLKASLPETSRGGSLLRGLVFCGSNRRSNCRTEYWKESNGGMLGFWQGVYSSFSAKAQGRVRMLVLDDKMIEIPHLWKEQVLPHLVSANIPNVDILAANCQSPGIQALELFVQSKCNISCRCVSIEPQLTFESIDSNDLCTITAQLEALNGTDSEKGQYATSTGSYNIPSRSVDCEECLAGSDSLYEWLFWGLVVLGLATAYAFWSVRHYLSEYQQIPNTNAVTAHEYPCQNANNVLPKQ